MRTAPARSCFPRLRPVSVYKVLFRVYDIFIFDAKRGAFPCRRVQSSCRRAEPSDRGRRRLIESFRRQENDLRKTAAERLDQYFDGVL